MPAQTFHCKDAGELAARMASHVAKIMNTAANATSISIPGGRDIVPFLQAFSKQEVDWSRVHAFMTDERLATRDAAANNFPQADALLFSKAKNIHPYPFDEAKGLDAYNRAFFSRTQGKMDIVLLGMGEDGHIASLFPRHPALASEEKGFIPISDAPLPFKERISLSPAAIRNADHVFLYAASASKQNAFEAFQDPTMSEQECPAKLALRAKQLWVYTIF